MRPSNKSRSRNKSGSSSQRRSNVGNIVNRVFESAGPDGKVRGTPQQVIEKYQGLARDAQVSGDRVAAENYLQHAEHYARLLGEAQRQTQEARQDRDDRDGQQRDDGQRDDDRRDDGQRDDSQRDDGQRDDSRRDDDRREREHGQRDHGQREHASQRDDQRQEAGERPQRRAPSRAAEPAALATFGGDETRGESGPVDTPESAGWSDRPDVDVPAPVPAQGERAKGEHRLQVVNGDHSGDQSGDPSAEQETAAGDGEAAAPKRPRRRRTKQVAPAPAD
jgi:hypothetical protein